MNESASNCQCFRLRHLAVCVAVLALLGAVTLFAPIPWIKGLSGFLFACMFLMTVLMGTPWLDSQLKKSPPYLIVIVMPLVYFILTFSFALFEAVIDQPHPDYVSGNWFTEGCPMFLSYGAVFATISFVLMVLDLLFQRIAFPQCKCDMAYYPQAINLCKMLSSWRSRLVLCIGSLLLLGYYANTVLHLCQIQQSAGGLIWPSQRVLFTCMVGWGILWVADSLSRPRCGTLAAAMGFLCSCLFLIQSSADAVLRE